MGFFDRLTKSLRGKNSEPAPRVEVSYGGVSLYPAPTTRVVTQVAPVSERDVPNTQRMGQDAASEMELSTSKQTAVAVAELPEFDDSFSSTAESNNSLFESDLDADLDDMFASLLVQETLGGDQVTQHEETLVEEDQSAVETLFADIAANYARPIKNFIFELKRGTATKDWIEICRPAMHGITRAAEGMGLKEAAMRMVDFETALGLAQNGEDRVLVGDVRDLLLLCYEDLIKVMPQAFVLGEEEQQREGIIIDSLLKQIPDVGRVTIDKLYRAGLTSLATLYLAKRDDLAVATGIPAQLSERICEKFQAYKKRLENSSRDLNDSRERLAMLLDELRMHHEGYQQASEKPSASEDKRACREQRQSCVLWINVLLAEIGELDLINELEKLSFERRIKRLEEYLATPPASM